MPCLEQGAVKKIDTLFLEYLLPLKYRRPTGQPSQLILYNQPYSLTAMATNGVDIKGLSLEMARLEAEDARIKEEAAAEIKKISQKLSTGKRANDLQRERIIRAEIEILNKEIAEYPEFVRHNAEMMASERKAHNDRQEAVAVLSKKLSALGVADDTVLSEMGVVV